MFRIIFRILGKILNIKKDDHKNINDYFCQKDLLITLNKLRNLENANGKFLLHKRIKDKEIKRYIEKLSIMLNSCKSLDKISKEKGMELCRMVSLEAFINKYNPEE